MSIIFQLFFNLKFWTPKDNMMRRKLRKFLEFIDEKNNLPFKTANMKSNNQTL